MNAMSPAPLTTLAPEQTETARRWFAEMAFIRAFEAQAQALSVADPPRVSGSMHLCAGQEAVPVGALDALAADDQVIATYRGHGWALAAGLDPAAVMAEICHKATGINGGRAGSAYMMAPWTRFIGENSIVGAGTTIACGVALSDLLQRSSRLVVVSIGDGALNQGSVHEAMAFAAARSLPVVFIVENNGWSELTATADMFRIPRLAQRAVALRRSASHLDTLAAASAETGQFTAAVELQREALRLVPAETESPEARAALRAELEERLATYQQGRPWREPDA